MAETWRSASSGEEWHFVKASDLGPKQAGNWCSSTKHIINGYIYNHLDIFSNCNNMYISVIIYIYTCAFQIHACTCDPQHVSTEATLEENNSSITSQNDAPNHCSRPARLSEKGLSEKALSWSGVKQEKTVFHQQKNVINHQTWWCNQQKSRFSLKSIQKRGEHDWGNGAWTTFQQWTMDCGGSENGVPPVYGNF